jgi:hypothetical protein
MSERDAAPNRAVVSLCSTPRLSHLRGQLAALADDGVRRVVVWVGADDAPSLDAHRVLHVPPGADGLRLAAGRNAGAEAALSAGAELLIFLDADCVPGPALVARYTEVAAHHPDAVLCGPVTYLPPGIDVTDEASLRRETAPHRARPNPPDGEERPSSPDEYDLFWSLSFAAPATVWRRSGGFDPRYEGYGGEDTDFARTLRRLGIPMMWVGGAHAYHQHHPTQSPPWAHLDDILRNGATFAGKWGEWPMGGWLRAFADAGAIEWDGHAWVRTR